MVSHKTVPRIKNIIGKQEFINENEILNINDPYMLSDPTQNVAVLINGEVASSGEIATISFVGRPNTRFFGAPTCGISQARKGFTLNDGATLWLAVRNSADKDKNLIEGKILPDDAAGQESIIETAVNWLEN